MQEPRKGSGVTERPFRLTVSTVACRSKLYVQAFEPSKLVRYFVRNVFKRVDRLRVGECARRLTSLLVSLLLHKPQSGDPSGRSLAMHAMTAPRQAEMSYENGPCVVPSKWASCTRPPALGIGGVQ